jgi:hypothetical protein
MKAEAITVAISSKASDITATIAKATAATVAAAAAAAASKQKPFIWHTQRAHT